MLKLLNKKKETNEIDSFELTIEKIVNKDYKFNIPIYQRLYVWGKEQISTLLEDLHRAYQKDETQKYYLGGIMVFENKKENKIVYDLIDGQQRFTTLWLLSKVLGHSLEQFLTVKSSTSKTRISFSVRDFANKYFNDSSILNQLAPSEADELKSVVEALKIIKTFINDNDQAINKKSFSNFILKNIQFIFTVMPPNTEVNKLFEIMNNRGIQLQQHEILKNSLLRKIVNPSTRHKYSIIWDACSNMNEYLEKNIKEVANLKWKQLFPKVEGDGEKTAQLPSLDKILEILDTLDKNGNSMNLLDIIYDFEVLEKNEADKENNSEEDYESGSIRSIISFPMLLLHVLRIYQYQYWEEENFDKIAEVKGKDLIQIFELHKNYLEEEKDIIAFLDYLWELRELFDTYVIKWVKDDDSNEETHLIKKLSQTKTSFNRQAPKTNQGFALIQSMLYHSQQITTHYWLTPFLNICLEVIDTKGRTRQTKRTLYQYLMKLDNAMFCNPKLDLRTNSYNLMSVPTNDLKGSPSYIKETLTDPQGTGFPSYWFYKLEFILWKNRVVLDKDEEWKNYKMTAKNSVEHISPQNPKPEDINLVFSFSDDEKTIKDKQNDFGNLVLLSTGMNSEYSNKFFTSKRSEFEAKANVGKLDSLKSDLIFTNSKWDWSLCQKHRNKVIKLFEKYLEEC